MDLMKSLQPAVSMVCAAVFLLFYCQNSTAQIGIDTREIEPLINQWNFAHNARSSQSFREVYDDRVVFYAQQLNRSACIAMKQKLFREHRDYGQKIASPIKYKAYTSGVIKCDFTKEVTKDGVVWRYPAYLLVSYENNKYKIVGESDDATDKTLNYYLQLGEPLDIPIAAEEKEKLTQNSDTLAAIQTPDSTAPIVKVDSAANVDSTSAEMPGGDSLAFAKKSHDSVSTANTASPLPNVSNETVTLPLMYVYVFIGLLVFGSLLILFLGMRSKRKNKKSTVLSIENTGKHDHYDKEQSDVFEKFVLMLFDPLYFRSFKVKSKNAVGNGFTETESYPHLELEFNRKDSHATFAVESLYIPELKYKDIEIASPEKIKAYQQLDEDDHNLYLVLGIEGKPDDPKEIYLIPVREINQSYISYPNLQKYRKYGMFSYNTESGRLQ